MDTLPDVLLPVPNVTLYVPHGGKTLAGLSHLPVIVLNLRLFGHVASLTFCWLTH